MAMQNLKVMKRGALAEAGTGDTPGVGGLRWAGLRAELPVASLYEPPAAAELLTLDSETLAVEAMP